MNNGKKNFQMGQIIYLLSEKAEKIIPAIVTEEVLIKKLNGNTVSWKVSVGPIGKRKEVDSTRLNGEIYSSLEEIRTVMTKRLNDFVNNIVNDAKKRTDDWYGKQLVEQPEADGGGAKIDPASLIDAFEEKANNIAKPHIPNLSKYQLPQDLSSIKIKVPNPNGPLHPNSLSTSTAAILKQKYPSELVDMTMSDEDDVDVDVNNDFVLDEHGREIPVKYNIKE